MPLGATQRQPLPPASLPAVHLPTLCRSRCMLRHHLRARKRANMQREEQRGNEQAEHVERRRPTPRTHGYATLALRCNRPQSPQQTLTAPPAPPAPPTSRGCSTGHGMLLLRLQRRPPWPRLRDREMPTTGWSRRQSRWPVAQRTSGAPQQHGGVQRPLLRPPARTHASHATLTNAVPHGDQSTAVTLSA